MLDQNLDVNFVVEVTVNQILGEALVENKNVIVLVQSILVDGHKSEEFRVYHLLSLQDAYFIREDLW